MLRKKTLHTYFSALGHVKAQRRQVGRQLGAGTVIHHTSFTHENDVVKQIERFRGGLQQGNHDRQ